MKGATEYAKLFKTGQYGNFYIVCGKHARGETFHVFVLPDGEDADAKFPQNWPRNPNAVEVYGIIGGHPGWTEYYGWKEKGPWVEDFYDLARSMEMEKKHKEEMSRAACEDYEREKEEKKKRILAAYKPQPF